MEEMSALTVLWPTARLCWRRKILELSSQLAAEPSTAALALDVADTAPGGPLDSLLDRHVSSCFLIEIWLWSCLP